MNDAELVKTIIDADYLVLPLTTAKAPLISGGYLKASRDPQVIKKWLRMQYKKLWGIPMQPCDAFAIDIDPDGINTWRDLIIENGEPPISPCQRTPRGGWHYVFKLPDGIDVPNDAGKFAPGIDLRSTGYIATGADGTGYEWIVPISTPLADAPGWILSRIQKITRPKPDLTPRTMAPVKTNLDTSAAGDYFLNKALSSARPGTRNQTGFELAIQLRDNGLTESQATEVMQRYADGVPQTGQDQYTRTEAMKSLHAAYTEPAREPAILPKPKQAKTATSTKQEPVVPAAKPLPAAKPGPAVMVQETVPEMIVTLQEAIREVSDELQTGSFTSWADMDKVIGPITWDWQNWLARGFLNILVGMVGEGKSVLSLRIAGCYLAGWNWPDGTPYTGKTGYVVWCEAEAAQALNLERAKKWGLPIDRILTPFKDPLTDFKLKMGEHKNSLENLLLRDDVVFAVVDSLSGADPTAEKSTEDAGNVNWLGSLARDTNKTIQLTHHLRKRGLFDTEGVVTLDRVRGMSTILQYARTIWALDTPDTNNKERKRLAVIKNNLGRKPEPIGVTIDDNGVTFGDAPETPHVETLKDKGVELLRSLIEKEPMLSTTIDAEFKNAGLSLRTQREAKQALNTISIRKGSAWYTGLPAAPTQRELLP